MKPVFYFLIVATFIGLCSANEQNTAIIMRVELCHFDLPEVVLRANITYGLHYRFEINKDGQPVNIETIDDKEGRFLSKQQVIDCISNWRLKGLNTDKPVNLLMVWKHAVGWVTVLIGNEDFHYSIKIPPGFNRYYARGEHWQHDEGGPVDQHIRDVEERTRAQFEE